jgi:N-acetylmuramic acid 6-phosphate etherase
MAQPTPTAEHLGTLLTETRNPATEHLDALSTLDMLTLINAEDATVAAAVHAELPHIAAAVDAIAARFARGGRLFYIGAGTSGRLGVLDASECPPTFSVDPTLVQGLIAGGDRALRLSSEHSEDSPEEGAADLTAAGFGQPATNLGAPGLASETWVEEPTNSSTPDVLVGIAASGQPATNLGAPGLASETWVEEPTNSSTPDTLVGIAASGQPATNLGAPGLASETWVEEPTNSSTPDVLVGIAASGRTPYVLGAIAHARSLGALTIGLSCVPNSALAQAADIAITPATGPEVLTGSTRLKAGTATKLVLNMLSTGVMVRSGMTFGNLMVNVRPTNAKLVDRAHRIIAEATGCDLATAAALLTASGSSVKTAIVMHQLSLDRASAEQRLRDAGGVLRLALQ